MKIRSTLRIATLLSISVVVIYIALAILIDRTVETKYRDLRQVSEIKDNFTKLRRLTNDYFLYQTERGHQQWLTVYGNFLEMLKTPELQAFQRKYDLEDMGDRVHLIRDAFGNLTASLDKAGMSEMEAEASKEFQNRLITQILLTTREMDTNFGRVVEDINREVVSLQHQSNWIGITALFILILFIMAHSIFLSKSVVQPVLKLHLGAEIVGQGNLDYKIGFNSRNEVGELSRALDSMTANLKQVTVSRDDLAAEIEERNRVEEALRDRTIQLEAANKEMESFTYSVSHDLKTPIRAIQGFSRMLMEEHADQLDTESRRLLNVVVDNTRLMDQLVDDLLTLSRLGRQEVQKLVIDMTAMTRSIFRQLQSENPERELELTVADLPQAQADRNLLHQVMLNLLGNAVKYTKGRNPARIEVGGRCEDDENIYYVKDNGVGFQMDYAHKLFGVFQRLHSGKEYEGTGVGLAIVQRIINRHGGRVWAEGKVNEGATFYFALPKNGELSFSGGDRRNR